MRRRLFVRVAALGTAASLSGVASCAPDADPAAEAALARPDLVDLLGADQARAIGARYREMVPEERDADALRAAIAGRHPLLARVLGTPRVDPAALVRRDFAEGRTVEVDGWVLSLTEARQCALLSLGAA